MEINESYDGFKWLFKKDSSSLHKLFDLYASEDGVLNKEEWILMTKDIFEKGIDKTAFKKGGKPSKQDMNQSFDLLKSESNDKISYSEFEKALQHLAHKVYKKKPKSKYVKFNCEDKLKKLLLWATTLQKSGHKPVKTN